MSRGQAVEVRSMRSAERRRHAHLFELPNDPWRRRRAVDETAASEFALHEFAADEFAVRGLGVDGLATDRTL
jgi:hypothetical protein